MERSRAKTAAAPKQLTHALTQANLLDQLYWYLHVVEAGSISAAAERTGIAKSSLSRRIIQLEKHLGVQLLSRTSRNFAMTTLGEQVYRHALDVLAVVDRVQASAQEARGAPGGLLRVAAPAILSDWLLGQFAGFQATHPKVSFALTTQDSVAELASQRLDLALSLNEIPTDSGELVARPVAELANVIVGSPRLLERLDDPRRLAEVPASALLAGGPPQALQPWRLHDRLYLPHGAAFTTENLQMLREAAKAGLGLACLPLCACLNELAAGTLRRACTAEAPLPATLYALTPAHRGITQTVRSLIQHLRDDLADGQRPGMQPARVFEGPSITV
ncbi:MAG: LysR substrate-binding domain-containing protein [Pseudomonas sp.]|uniref:LysR family transcriptional regulator n=1 Tax=Pseudomonas sp. TaxID=306 RepID=UPI00339695B7